MLVLDTSQALSVSDDPPTWARTLMGAFWPGALTLVLRRRPGLEADLGGDGITIGVRVPDNDIVRELCRRVGPLAVTSANVHGEPPLTTAAAVEKAFAGDVAVVVDGGTCAGDPSTVVDCTGDAAALIREGRIPWKDIQAAIS
jgi:tRNA threonylcarbamoyl adenosine modification protein (Sua5/YciO/YrdC/YwlC family)